MHSNTFKISLLLSLLFLIYSPVLSQKKVVSFKGAQVTGITISETGRLFANFPRWRKDIPYSVVEVMDDGSIKPYPNSAWNIWSLDQKPQDNQFISVQAMWADADKLYVIETANPQFKGIITTPKVQVFDLKTNSHLKTYTLTDGSFTNNTYINDMRIDHKRDLIFLTDSGAGGIITIDLKTGISKGYLTDSKTTKAEVETLTFDNGIWKGTVNSDGIALNEEQDILYFHALSGYTLYEINIEDLLNNDTSNIKSYTTGAPDGMLLDAHNRLFLANLEENKIEYLSPDRNKTKTLAQGKKVNWADTFSIYDGYFYYTNSRINEATGDISDMEFEIYKIKLPKFKND